MTTAALYVYTWAVMTACTALILVGVWLGLRAVKFDRFVVDEVEGGDDPFGGHTPLPLSHVKVIHPSLHGEDGNPHERV